MKIKQINLVALIPALVLGALPVAHAGTCTPPCLVSGSLPEVVLDDTTAGQQDWEIEGRDALEIDQSGGSSPAFKIEPGAGDDNLVIDDANNIGINTDAPQLSNELEVAGNGGSTDTFAAVAVSPGGPSDDSARFSVNDFSDTLTLGVRTGSGGYNNPVTIDLDATNNKLVVTAQGRVGLGGKTIEQVNSASQLHVAGSGSTSGNVFLDDVGSAGDWLIDPGGDGLWLRNGSTTTSTAPVKFQNSAPVDSLVLASSGSVGLGTSLPEATLHARTSQAGYPQVFQVQNAGSANALFRFQTNHAMASIDFNKIGDTFRLNMNDGDGWEMELKPSGAMEIKGALTQNSDRNNKQSIEPVDGASVLEAVASLPVSTWEYKDQSGVKHLGPMAQDFHAAFGLGKSPTGISSIDTGGVALAAIQGLNEIVQEKDAEFLRLIEAKDAELESLHEQVQELQAGQKRLAKLEELLRKLAVEEDLALR